MQLTPITYYQQQKAAGVLRTDPIQEYVVNILDNIYHHLLVKHRWYDRYHIKKNKITGLYLWGSFGVGKTLMLDIFYNCCPVSKMRIHLHAFLRLIHAELRSLTGKKQRNPLSQIAKRISAQYKVLCFDEFFISDVADAMLLSELLQALFAENIVLITTSNVAPDALYQDGLQRDRFLPVIAAIKQYTTVYEMQNTQDYRLQFWQQQAGNYFFPLSQDEKLFDIFQHLLIDDILLNNNFTLLDHQIVARQRTATAIWFDFEILCNIPRSQNDYLALAESYNVVFISNIPCLTTQPINMVTAFMNLIDVLYDMQIYTVMSAAVAIPELYPDGRLRFIFQRIESRLMEMQTQYYLNKCVKFVKHITRK